MAKRMMNDNLPTAVPTPKPTTTSELIARHRKARTAYLKAIRHEEHCEHKVHEEWERRFLLAPEWLEDDGSSFGYWDPRRTTLENVRQKIDAHALKLKKAVCTDWVRKVAPDHGRSVAKAINANKRKTLRVVEKVYADMAQIREDAGLHAAQAELSAANSRLDQATFDLLMHRPLNQSEARAKRNYLQKQSPETDTSVMQQLVRGLCAVAEPARGAMA